MVELFASSWGTTKNGGAREYGRDSDSFVPKPARRTLIETSTRSEKRSTVVDNERHKISDAGQHVIDMLCF